MSFFTFRGDSDLLQSTNFSDLDATVAAAAAALADAWVFGERRPS